MQFAKIVCHIYFPESQTAWECNLLFSGNKTAPDQYNNKQQDWDRCYPREDHYFKEIIHPSPVSSWPMKKKKNKAHHNDIVQPQILTQMLSLNT